MPDTPASALRASLTATRGADPEREAKLRQLAAETGLPVEALQAGSADEIKQFADQQSEPEADTFARDFPATAAYLSDPENAAIARDQHSPLSIIEQTLHDVGGMTSSAIKGMGANLIGASQMLNDATGYSRLQEFASPGSTQRANTSRQDLAAQAQKDMPVYDNVILNGVAQGVVSFVQNVPAMAAGLVTRNPEVSLALMGTSTGGGAYGEALDAGKSKLEAGRYAITQGVVEILTEKIPAEQLFKSFAEGAGFLATVGKQLAEELPGEQVATLLQDFDQWVTLNPEKPVGEFLRERPNAALMTAIATVVATTPSASAAHLVDAVSRRRERQDAVRAQQAANDTLKRTVAMAEASVVRERSTSSFEQFVAQATEGGPVENVYINVEDLAQSGVDVAALAQAIPSLEPQIAAAVATGGNIRIPTSELLAYATAKPEGQTPAGESAPSLAQQILPHLKTDPNGMSQAEAEVFMQQEAAALKSEVEATIAQTKDQENFRASFEAVKADIANKLNATGRFTADVNDVGATMIASFYATQAQRLGITPQEMATRYPLGIRAEGVTGETPKTLDQRPKRKPMQELPTDAAGFVTLSHWSAKGNLSLLDPSRWGDNWDVLPDEEKVRVGDAPGRTYYGVGTGQPGQYTPEYGVGPYRYETKVARDSLYNLDKDPLGLRKKAQAEIKAGMDKGEKLADYESDILTRLEQLVQESGFDGYWVDSPEIGVVATYYKEVKPKRRGRYSDPFYTPPATGSATIDDFAPENLPELLSKDGWAILTAENPMGKELSAKKNAERNDALEAALTEAGIEFHRVVGRYNSLENSYILLGVSETVALQIGRQWNQDSILNRRGLLYMDGTIEPAVGITTHDTRPSDFFTEVPETGGMFTIDIAFTADGFRRAEDVQRQLNQPAYHGTPHKFEAFSLDHIGTGEGAQAYGWGLYFAGNRSVAEYYRSMLAGPDLYEVSTSGTDGQPWHVPSLLLNAVNAATTPGAFTTLPPGVNDVVSALTPGSEQYDAIVAATFGHRRVTAAAEVAQAAAQVRGMLERGEIGFEVKNEAAGRLFTVHVPEDSELMSYDEPLAAQPQGVLDAAQHAGLDLTQIGEQEFGFETPTGELWGYSHPNMGQVYYLLVDSRDASGRPNFDVARKNAPKSLRDAITRLEAGPELRFVTRRASPKGRNIYERLSSLLDTDTFKAAQVLGDAAFEMTPDERASKYLRHFGVPGMRYLDQGSRGTDGARTSNYVVFDEAAVKVVEFEQSANLRAGGTETLKKYGLKPGKRYTTREVAAALEARTRAKFGTIDRKDRSPAAAKKIAKWISEEVKFEMQHPEKSGAGWYSYKFQEALDVFGDWFPELKTDQKARDIMTALIAVTSDGQKVVPNFAQAADLYSSYRKTGRFETSRGHVRQDSIDANVAKIQELYDTMDAGQVREYLMQTAAVSQLKKLAAESGLQFSTSYQAHIELPLAAVIFGPKLGAFYANLMGAHGYLTMDRWWSRTFNRYRGTLLTAPTREGLDRFKELMAKDRGLNAAEISDDEVLAGVVPYRNAYAKRGFKAGSEIEKAANTIYNAAFENLEDQPFNASDRTFMLTAVGEAQKQLAKDGVDISVADIQAVLWYYEKRLYGDLGAKDSADISYKEAAQRVVAAGRSGSLGRYDAEADQAAAQEDPRRVPPGDDLFGELEQRQPTAAPRGSFNPATSVITLGQAADLSTFHHEAGHFFLEVLADMASQKDAPADVVRDMDTVLKWFGVADLKTWRAMSLDRQRASHEKFARGYEAFLFEGRAPSIELQSVFQRLRSWLISIYRQITALNVNLNDEVRGVYGRLLATENEIAEAEAAQGYAPLLDTKPEGMSADEWAVYQSLGARATQEAISSLGARSLRDMQWLSNARGKMVRALQRQANEKRAAIRREVTNQVALEPVYRAMAFLKHGKVNGETVPGAGKLDIEAVKAMYADLPVEMRDFTKLGYGKYGMLSNEGLDPDGVAELFGFDSGHALVEALLNAEPLRDKINGITDQRMLERHGDLTDPDSIAHAADAAIHNDARLRFVETEANALAKAVGGRKILGKAARSFARDMVARMRIRDLRPSRYGSAERRAANNAQKYAKAGDLKKAATEKRNQLINGYAMREAVRAQEDVEKAVRYLSKFETEGTRRGIDPEYRDQIDALLERFDLRKSVTGKDAERRKSLVDWIESQRERGLEPAIPPELINEAYRKPFKEMTVEELRGLVDSVRNIAHLGRMKKRLLTAKDQREFAVIAADVEQTIRDNATRPARDAIESNSWLDRTSSGIREFFALHRKFASLLREMGGFKDGGVLWEVFVRPMNAAADREAVMIEKASIALHEIFAPIIKAGGLRTKMFIPAINRSLSLEGRLAIALNWGNELNRARIMDGDKWTEEQVGEILRTLTADQWRFVQDVWAHIDSYWPQIQAKERRVTGLDLEKQEALPFTVTTSDGQTIDLPGGYYPIKYDPNRSERAQADELADHVKQTMQGLYTRAQTRSGFRKARVEVVERPVRKDLGVIFQHITEVAHDLAWHEYLIDANRMLRDGGVASAIREHYGPEVYKVMSGALKDMAAGDVPAFNAAERAINHVRTGATIAGLGWNLTTALLQPLGLTQSIVRIGPKWVLQGLARIGRDAASMQSSLAWVYDRSDFMRLRGKTMQREISEIRNKISPGGNTPLSAVSETFFILIGKMQIVADLPTWIGQYEKSIAAGADDATAIAQADQAVLDSQGGGQIKDLAAIQRGGPLQKLWTNFYSYFNVSYNLLAESVGQTKLVGASRLPLLAADVALLLFIPTILSEVIRTAMKGDDWDELPGKLPEKLLSSVFGLMVGVRDLGQGSLAGLRFLETTQKFADQVKQGEVDESFLKAANNAAGVVFHYPAGQVQRTAMGIQALANGDTKNPLVLIAGPPPKEQ